MTCLARSPPICSALKISEIMILPQENFNYTCTLNVTIVNMFIINRFFFLIESQAIAVWNKYIPAIITKNMKFYKYVCRPSEQIGEQLSRNVKVLPNCVWLSETTQILNFLIFIWNWLKLWSTWFSHLPLLLKST